MTHWFRNVVFFGVCLAAMLAVVVGMLRPPRLVAPQNPAPAMIASDGFSSTVAKVDEAFEAHWRHSAVSPVEPAPSLAIIRRLSLALTGTIPSLEEIRALESVPEGERSQWWLSRLFEDRRHGDYLAERFTRMLVGVEDGPFIVYRRHRLSSWLSDQIMANRPYDELARELIAAEGIWTSHPEVNFVTVTMDQNNKEEGPDQVKLAGRVARAFLGVRLDCVECHDDFLGGSWKQRDFHQLAAFFAQSEMSMTGVWDNAAKSHQYRMRGQSEPAPVQAAVPFNAALLKEEGDLRRRLAGWVTHPENRPFARAAVNRIWALMFNQPLHQPVDDIPIEGKLPPGMEELAGDFIEHGFDLRRLIRLIAATRVFQMDSRSSDGSHPATPEQGKALATFPLTRIRPEQVAGSLLQSANLQTIDANSHVLVRVIRFMQQNDFVKRYGDMGEDEFGVAAGTIPQRLILMNGKLVHERTKQDLVMNAATRVGVVSPDEETAVETAYLVVLTRRPTPEESAHFVSRLKNDKDLNRSQLMEDLFWTLLNSTEFSWNH